MASVPSRKFRVRWRDGSSWLTVVGRFGSYRRAAGSPAGVQARRRRPVAPASPGRDARSYRRRMEADVGEEAPEARSRPTTAARTARAGRAGARAPLGPAGAAAARDRRRVHGPQGRRPRAAAVHDRRADRAAAEPARHARPAAADPRGPAVAIVMGSVVALLTGIGFLLADPVSDQVSALQREIPGYVDDANSALADLQDWLDRRGIEVEIKQEGETRPADDRRAAHGRRRGGRRLHARRGAAARRGEHRADPDHRPRDLRADLRRPDRPDRPRRVPARRRGPRRTTSRRACRRRCSVRPRPVPLQPDHGHERGADAVRARLVRDLPGGQDVRRRLRRAFGSRS